MNTTATLSPTTTEELAAARDYNRAHRMPPAMIKIVDDVVADLEAEQASDHSLQVGDAAPDFVLPTSDGRNLRLHAALRKGPVVLVFYRGGWCPYCNLHLRGFQKLLPQFQAAGAQLIAISPELPDHTLTTREKAEQAFPVLSDVGLSTARAYQISFEVPTAMVDLYAANGKALVNANGESGATALPMPATFVIRADNQRIAFAQVDADYTRRAEPLEVLAVVKKLAAASSSRA